MDQFKKRNMLDYLFEFLKEGEELNCTLSSYFAELVLLLVDYDKDILKQIMDEKMRVIMKFIYQTSISDMAIKLIKKMDKNKDINKIIKEVI